jgi:hypothetical protein
MKADAPATPCRKLAPLPPPPALLAVRARSRSRVADLGFGAASFPGPPDTPPRRSPVTVPFLWEEAPGKPKAPPPPTAVAPAATNTSGGGDEQHDDQARPVPLKLPPRLQQVASASLDTPLLPSPKAVLQGPYYYGCAGDGSRRPPPRWFRSGGAFRRTPSAAGVGLFSRTWSKPAPASGKNRRGDDHERDAAGPDAPWCSPASSSSSSVSSVSTCFGGDEHGRGKPCADGREVSSEEDGGGGGSPPRGSVRITRLKRNRSLPSVTTSNLWVRTSSFLLSSAFLVHSISMLYSISGLCIGEKTNDYTKQRKVAAAPATSVLQILAKPL